jgi:hypothetical protein
MNPSLRIDKIFHCHLASIKTKQKSGQNTCRDSSYQHFTIETDRYAVQLPPTSCSYRQIYKKIPKLKCPKPMPLCRRTSLLKKPRLNQKHGVHIARITLGAIWNMESPENKKKAHKNPALERTDRKNP